jgi:hypothetical protein
MTKIVWLVADEDTIAGEEAVAALEQKKRIAVERNGHAPAPS